MIVGWRVAAHMRTTMVLDAVDMAAWSRGARIDGLRCHSDAGSQGGIRRSSQHLERGGCDEFEAASTSDPSVAWSDAVAGSAAGVAA